jgi:hypothetical protein
MKKALLSFSSLLFAAFVIASLAIVLLNQQSTRSAKASGPTLTPSTPIVQPGQTFAVTATGFAAGESVQVRRYFGGPVLGTLACDGSGNCSGNVTAPTGNVRGDIEYNLTGTGTVSGLRADAQIAFSPAIFIPSMTGIPGSSIHLSGAGFFPLEMVQVYFGSTSEGTTTTTYSGNLKMAFNAPGNIGVGVYTITVARTGHTPSGVTTNYQVLPAQVSAFFLVQQNLRLLVSLSGFGSYESVIITDGLGHSFAAGSDKYGRSHPGISFNYGVFQYARPPRGSALALTVTVTGQTSGLVAQSKVFYGDPGVSLSPNTAPPGSTITVNGGGYNPGQTVTVSFNKSSTLTTTAIADANGNFSVPLTVALNYSAHASYFVFGGSNSAKAQFFFTTPLLLSSSSATYGMPQAFSGVGFAPGEQVYLTWPGPAVKVASDGTFSANVIAPSQPYQGNVTVTAYGATSKVRASTTIYEFAALILAPGTGSAGSQVRLFGGCFDGSEQVTLAFQNGSSTVATASRYGAFDLSFTVPATASLGAYTVQAKGNISGTTASATFYVIPTLRVSPGMGPLGTIVAVRGTSFDPNVVVTLSLYDSFKGKLTALKTVKSKATGQLVTTITIPTGLTPGQTYEIQALDTSGNIALTPFLVQ